MTDDFHTILIDPFPLSVDRLELSTVAKRIVSKKYDNDDELLAAIRKAPSEQLDWTIVRGLRQGERQVSACRFERRGGIHRKANAFRSPASSPLLILLFGHQVARVPGLRIGCGRVNRTRRNR